MYIPKMFEEKDKNEIAHFLEQNSFGTLVSVFNSKPIASHLPFHMDEINEQNILLSSHIAKENEIKNCFDERTLMIIFLGAHDYISPQWYKEMNVPTWNYLSVHLYGKVKVLAGDEAKKSLNKLMKKYEASQKVPKEIKDIPAKVFEQDFKNLIAFEFQVHEIHAAFKLSQNRDNESYKNIVYNLENNNTFPNQPLADEMKKKRPNLF